MITYVNTVLVSNLSSGAIIDKFADATVANAGKFLVLDVDADTLCDGAEAAAAAKRIKIGVINPDGKIKWSNIINSHDVKAKNVLSYADDTEDVVKIDFTNVNDAVASKWAEGNKRIIVRLTFKDLPTRYRNWTESYEYVTKLGDTPESIVKGIAAVIEDQPKRARVTAVAITTNTENSVTLTALPYDDDNSVDSINWYGKVRFSANVWFTDPDAPAFASRNKYFPQGLEIVKTPGKTYPATAKLVRDREATANGYLGILNQGACTWPIIKPAMVTDLSKHYDAITLEFENMYRAADDIFRKTKQTVEIYGVAVAGESSTLNGMIDAFIAGEYEAPTPSNGVVE